jgi:2-dehydro-3-deoxygluconokinase
MIDESLFRTASLCVVGNINRDIRTAPIAPARELFEDGETSTAFIRETLGGGGANSALAASHLGADVTFAGKVGADALGERLEKKLARHGIRALLARDPQNPTGTSVNLVFNSGHRHFVSSLPSSATFKFEDIDPAIFKSGGHLLRADIWFAEAMLFGGNEQLFKKAKAAGMAISIDLNWDPQWGIARPEFIAKRKAAVRAVLPLVDLVHGNINELNTFSEESDLSKTLSRLEEWGAGAVVVHMGDQGAGYYDGGKLIREAAIPAAQRVNATGTGDLLSVCMMLLHGRSDLSASEKLRLANTIVSEYIEGRRPIATEL